jgi:phosphoenolpyruvate carboxykinase (GTP)
VNNQYAGNSLGLKKLALRLAISKAAREDWLCEHMFIMGIHPSGKDRVTYFTGAFPSACGKTSTAMVPGQTIIGDDIAYLRIDDEGMCRAANVEQGIFGIIKDVNAEGDPVIFNALTSPGEVIFSNVLVKDGKPYWINMGEEVPEDGENFSGPWKKGKTDAKGNEVLHAHKNARYTLRINDLENADPKADDPAGVVVDGFIYGGRDSDTSVPVYQSLSWSHGVFAGTAIESETTSATLGAEGVRKHNPMANLDFLVLPMGKYIEKHLKFGDDLAKNPLIFATNYFLKRDGKFLNGVLDKKVWLLWAEGRVHDEYEAIETPIGLIPKFEDLRALFKDALGKDYTEADYIEQFSIRVNKNLERLDRIEAIYKNEDHVPVIFHEHIEQQRARLHHAKELYGEDVISPLKFEE